MGHDPLHYGQVKGSMTMPDGNQDRLRTEVAAPPRAGHFIVTLYGDVVEPRGGTLWMGRVIALCQAAGLSETLVRTAMSRLVAAGQFIGERVGRRSYYRLTPTAQVEFAQADALLFSPKNPPTDFTLLRMTDSETTLPPGFVPLRADMAIGPYRAGLAADRLVLRATVDQGAAKLPDFIAGLWDLEPLAQAYTAFLARFGPMLTAAIVDPQDALIARLLLVDCYRTVLWRDPHLPDAALPRDWPGVAARALFVRLYLQLSGPADSYIGQVFDESEGLTLHETPQLTARRAGLEAEEKWKSL